MTENSQLPLKPPAVPPSAFPGFFPRVSAFTIDVVLIYFIGYTLEMAFRDSLLRLGPWLPFLSALGAFTYFWLGNGPVGKGATLGKSILGLRVVKADGSPLDLAAGFRRTVLQLPTIFGISYIFLASTLNFSLGVTQIGFEILNLIATIIYFTHAYCILAHPRRRGWHDEWVGAYVTRDPTPESFREAMSEPPDEIMALRLRTHKRVSRIFCLIVSVLFGGSMVRVLVQPGIGKTFEIEEAGKRDLAFENYRLQQIRLLSVREWQKANDEMLLPSASGERIDLASIFPDSDARDDREANEPEKASADADADTSVTARSRGSSEPERPILMLQYNRKFGAVAMDEAGDPDFQKMIESLRVRAPRAYEKYYAQPENDPPRWLVAWFGDEFRFVTFSLGGSGPGARLRYVFSVQGPLDRDLGELIYQPIRVEREKEKAKEESRVDQP